jgi:excisionase family DNA binding protein
MNKTDNFLKAQEVVDILKISKSELILMVRNGEIDHYRLGPRKVRFRESDIIKFINDSFRPARGKK